MLLQTFCAHIERTTTLPEFAVICFSGNTYPLLFFYHLFSFVKKHGVIVEYIDCSNNDISSIKALLSTISLAGTTLYWLENFNELSAKKQQELLSYLNGYNGPHRVLFFSEEAPTLLAQELMEIVTLPDKIAAHEFSMVRFLVNDIQNGKTEFARHIALHTDSLSLDSACLFAHYEVVVGRSVTEFFSQWAVNIIEPTRSLFVLSQYFFSKKRKSFFQQWATVAELYMPAFWATFWADQIWRAYIFCDLMNKKKYAEAKKAQYKLPFSLVNRDWSLYSAAELRNMHQFLTTMDFRLKNGGSEICFEHFYSQFFDNKFR
jgi:hypothetical protein